LQLALAALPFTNEIQLPAAGCFSPPLPCSKQLVLHLRPRLIITQNLPALL
jgi:hypothetical protein